MSKILCLAILVQAFFAIVSAADCDKNSTNKDTGTFMTPNYPNNYVFGSVCTWRIEVAAGSKIVLTFLNNVTDITSSDGGDSGCGTNNVEVTKDPTSQDVHPTYCKQIQPAGDITSKDNVMIVKFTSTKNENVQSKGFSASFVTLAPPTTTTTTTTVTTTTIAPPNTTKSTNKAPITQPPAEKKLSKGAIAGICIVVILVVLLIIDVILYQKEMGVIYTCKQACCGGYGAVSQ